MMFPIESQDTILLFDRNLNIVLIFICYARVKSLNKTDKTFYILFFAFRYSI